MQSARVFKMSVAQGSGFPKDSDDFFLRRYQVHKDGGDPPFRIEDSFVRRRRAGAARAWFAKLHLDARMRIGPMLAEPSSRCYNRGFGRVAQLAEQLTLNQ